MAEEMTATTIVESLKALIAKLGGEGADESTIVEALKTMYVTLGGTDDLANANTIVEVLNKVTEVAEAGGGSSVEPAKDINFIDYDGTIVKSYTLEEWADVNELPKNPEHEGLISDGWNYTLEEINHEVEVIGKCTIGQYYSTVSGATEIEIELPENALSPYMTIYEGTCTIDWGDGSEKTIKDSSGQENIQHIYNKAGRYTISITTENAQLSGASTYSQVLWDMKTMAYRNANYNNAIRRVHFMKGVACISNAFSQCWLLEGVSFSRSYTTALASGVFRGCTCLSGIVYPCIEGAVSNECFTEAGIKMFSIPPTITSIGQRSFEFCRTNCCIPSHVNTIAGNAFRKSLLSGTVILTAKTIDNSALQECYGITKLVLKGELTSFSANYVSASYGLKELWLFATNPPTFASGSYSIPDGAVIYVPTESVEAYKNASGWSTYADRIQAMPA